MGYQPLCSRDSARHLCHNLPSASPFPCCKQTVQFFALHQPCDHQSPKEASGKSHWKVVGSLMTWGSKQWAEGDGVIGGMTHRKPELRSSRLSSLVSCVPGQVSYPLWLSRDSSVERGGKNSWSPRSYKQRNSLTSSGNTSYLPNHFQWQSLPRKVSEPFLDAICPKAMSLDCDSPHTSFLHCQDCSLDLELRTASVWAVLAIDGWVIGTDQQVFRACQSGPLICMIAHSEAGTCTQCILARAPTCSTEPAPAVLSRLFKQGLPGAGPGCWGETVCYWLRSLDWQPGLRDSCTGRRPQEASTLLGWDICSACLSSFPRIRAGSWDTQDPHYKGFPWAPGLPQMINPWMELSKKISS